MPIPEAQLETWSRQGATVTAARTHKSIRVALDAHEWPDWMRFDVYLQGSYANATNIRGNSDVDLVVEATSVHYSNLTADEKRELGLRKGSHNWSEFRAEVVQALRSYYGSSSVDLSGGKSVKVLAGSGRLPADVVSAVRYKRYKDKKVQVSGITFWSHPEKEKVINYPKTHIKYGAAKNGSDRTNSWYKPVVRVFKNARESVINGSDTLRDRYPSYFIECLIHEVPDKCFGGSYQDTFVAIVSDLDARLSSDGVKFICQNRHQWLFGSSSTSWTKEHAIDFIGAVASLWNNW